jgi:hypothetical protein
MMFEKTFTNVEFFKGRLYHYSIILFKFFLNHAIKPFFRCRTLVL